MTATTTFLSLINEIQDATLPGSTQKQVVALARISDLFAAGSSQYSEQQVEVFDEIFKTLVAVIELKTRVRLARRLATDPNAPATLVRAFAADEAVAVAAPVLSKSAALSDADLAASAGTQSQGHLYAIAQRQAISATVTDILIKRGEPRVVHAVAENPGARISDGSYGELVARSADDVRLALRVGTRRDIPRHHFLKLLETASASVFRKIVAAHPQFADAVQGVVTEVVDNINRQVRAQSPDHARARRKVERFKYWRELRETNVHAFASVHNFEHTVMALSVLAGCPIEMAERAVLHENPGVVQILGRAAGCSWTTVKAVLLIKAAGRKMSATDLDLARENFDRLEIRTARRVLDVYTARRDASAVAPTPVVPEASENLEALIG